LKTQAMQVAEKDQPGIASVGRERFALPRPFSPFHWQLIIKEGEDYQVASLDLLAQGSDASPDKEGSAWKKLLFAYRSRDDLRWTHYSLYGSEPSSGDLAREVWQQEDLAHFRDFAVFPVLYRIDYSVEEVCIWFTDLRYVIPGMPPAFRFGMCRFTREGQWRLYRLRYITDNQRQVISGGTQ